MVVTQQSLCGRFLHQSIGQDESSHVGKVAVEQGRERGWCQEVQRSKDHKGFPSRKEEWAVPTPIGKGGRTITQGGQNGEQWGNMVRAGAWKVGQPQRNIWGQQRVDEGQVQNPRLGGQIKGKMCERSRGVQHGKPITRGRLKI